MKVHPQRTSLLYIHDILYVNLCNRQVWEAKQRQDGKYELRHGCIAIIVDAETYDNFFEGGTEDGLEKH